MAKAELPEGIQERLDTLEESMTALEAELEPLLSTPWDVLTSKMEPLEKAKLNLMIAYAADSLFFLYLKTQVRIATTATPNTPCAGTSFSQACVSSVVVLASCGLCVGVIFRHCLQARLCFVLFRRQLSGQLRVPQQGVLTEPTIFLVRRRASLPKITP